ncbi:MAG: hypothetical protein JWN51_2001 [Phycisphaerales bacterium]|nr:hypothetical protein [Phycisphaerales bacterium]
MIFSGTILALTLYFALPHGCVAIAGGAVRMAEP